MNVEYSKRAVSDLRRIADYHTRLDDRRVAERIAAGIKEAVGGLAHLPDRGRPVAERPGVRVVLMSQYRYKIFYRLAGETVRIVRIRHTSRRPFRRVLSGWSDSTNASNRSRIASRKRRASSSCSKPATRRNQAEA